MFIETFYCAYYQADAVATAPEAEAAAAAFFAWRAAAKPLRNLKWRCSAALKTCLLQCFPLDESALVAATALLVGPVDVDAALIPLVLSADANATSTAKTINATWKVFILRNDSDTFRL